MGNLDQQNLELDDLNDQFTISLDNNSGLKKRSSSKP